MILTPLPLLTAMTFPGRRPEHPDGAAGRDAGADLFRIARPLGLSGSRACQFRFETPSALMCGIAGFAGTGDRADLASMTTALAHRGPDGEGFHIDERAQVYLGHRRLAILDIAGGSQPMWNEDGTIAVIFNGEIYNHHELRARTRGARPCLSPPSHSDTEVLVHGYEEWGEELPIRLNGMFAFSPSMIAGTAAPVSGARPVRREAALLLPRGPAALRLRQRARPRLAPASSGVQRRRSILSALQKFFAYGYLPAPTALYAGARKLPAGHHLTLDLASGERASPATGASASSPTRFARPSADEAALVEELRHLLAQAVERRLISDVPLGMFLSGGHRFQRRCWRAARQHRPAGSPISFTIGFTEPSFDESGYARQVAQHFGTHHREQMLDLETARDRVPALLGRLDEPLGDASLLPTHLLSEFTRRHVTVALSGDGGDELFAGYDPFKALTPARFYRPADAARPASRRAPFAGRSAARSRPRNMGFDFKLKRSLKWACRIPHAESVESGLDGAARTGADGRDLLGAAAARRTLYSEAIDALQDPATGAADLVDETLEFFTNLYLTDDILTKSDRAAMMVSLEIARGVSRQRPRRILPAPAASLEIPRRQAEIPAEAGRPSAGAAAATASRTGARRASASRRPNGCAPSRRCRRCRRLPASAPTPSPRCWRGHRAGKIGSTGCSCGAGSASLGCWRREDGCAGRVGKENTDFTDKSGLAPMRPREFNLHSSHPRISVKSVFSCSDREAGSA